MPSATSQQARENLLYVFPGCPNGRTRRLLGACPSLRWRSDSGPATRPAAGAEGGRPTGPPETSPLVVATRVAARSTQSAGR